MIRIRPYIDPDRDTVLSWCRDEETFHRWTAGTMGDFPITPEKFEKTASVMRFTALDDDEPAGFFTVRIPGENSNELRFGYVLVDPDRRGRGIGRGMLTLGLQFAFQIYGAEQVTIGVLESNLPARACYQTVGFTETGVHETYHIAGTDQPALELEYRKPKEHQSGTWTEEKEHPIVNFTFALLNPALSDDLLPQLFSILARNMGEIAPTGNTYEEDQQIWLSYMYSDQARGKQILLAYADDILAGYLQYSITGDTVLIEEVEIAPDYQRTFLFYRLLQHFLAILPDGVTHAEAYINKHNCNSQRIAQKLGFQIIGENKSGSSYHLRGEMTSFQRFIH